MSTYQAEYNFECLINIENFRKGRENVGGGTAVLIDQIECQGIK